PSAGSTAGAATWEQRLADLAEDAQEVRQRPVLHDHTVLDVVGCGWMWSTMSTGYRTCLPVGGTSKKGPEWVSETVNTLAMMSSWISCVSIVVRESGTAAFDSG